MLFQLYSVALQHLVFILYPSHIPGEASQDSPSTTAMRTPSLALTANTGTEGSKDKQVHSQCPQNVAPPSQGVTGEGNKSISLLNIVFYNLQQSLEWK